MSRASADTQEVACDAAPLGAFAYDAPQYRVVFGSGTLARLGNEADRLGIRHALILTTRHQRSEGERIGGQLGSRFAATFANAEMHTPVEVTEAAVQVVETNDIDGLIAVGGGSTVGLSKALAARTGLPQIAVPTTYAGSEMTPILGETRGGIKTTQRSRDLVPDTVIYDVDLTLGLPPDLSASSGMNAIAHAVEALYAFDANPVTSLMAEEGIAALARALPRILDAPSDRAGRRDALYGAWLCGTCLGAVGMSLHHKLCHVLGGSFDLPHALTHAIVLPHVAAYNAPAAPEAMQRIARALGQPDAALGLYDLARRLNIPKRLADIGMPHAGIAEAADLATRNPYANPRPVDRAALQGLIGRAWDGHPPLLQ
jgi:alcohol dehydrogenase class IV